MLLTSPIIVSKVSLSISIIIIDAELVILDYKFIQNRICKALSSIFFIWEMNIS